MKIIEVLIEWGWGDRQRVPANNLTKSNLPGYAHYTSLNSGQEHLVKVIGKIESESTGEVLDIDEIPALA